MTRRHKTMLKNICMIPICGLLNLATCQADALRSAARDLNDRANRIDEQDTDLGDLLSDLVEDL